MADTAHAVDGMTCAHCVQAITGEVSKLPGVSEVAVDLAARTVTVSGSDLDDVAVRAAVAEAGYAVVG